MINSRFFKSAIFVFLCVLAPTDKARSADLQTPKSDTRFYGKIFSLVKLSGESDFVDTGRAAVNAWDDSHTKSPDGYHNGTVLREYRPTHGFSMMGLGLAVGYHIQETKIEFEALLSGASKLASKHEEVFFGVADIPEDKATVDNKLDGVAFAPLGPMKFTNFKYSAALINLYHDFDAGNILKIFLGGGVGIARVNYHLSKEQDLTSFPIIAQGKVGLSFDVDHLQKVGAVPYLGYTARYFLEKKAREEVTGLNVIRTKAIGFFADPTVEESTVEGVNFSPIARHLIHNLEVGITFSLDT